MRYGLTLIALATVAVAGTAMATRHPVASRRTVALTPTVSTSLNTATLRVRTQARTRLVVSVGTDVTYGLSLIHGMASSHSVTIAGVKPATRYFYKVRAVSSTGAEESRGTFTTGLVVPASMGVSGRRITLAGVPFFPIIAEIPGGGGPNDGWPDGWFDDHVAIGVNVLRALGGYCSTRTPEQCVADTHRLLDGRLWWIPLGVHPLQDDRAKLHDLPELLNWHSGIRLVVAPGPLIGCQRSNNSNETTKLYATIRRASRARPVVYMTLAGREIIPGRPSCLNEQKLRNLFWTVVAAGGSGIQYATATYGAGPGRPYDFGLTPEVRAAQARLSRELATLQPAILSGVEVDTRARTVTSVRFGSWRYAGVTYVIAVNTLPNAARSTFTIAGLGAANAPAEVLWERRTVEVRNGLVDDSFGPFAVHVYKFVPGAA